MNVNLTEKYIHVLTLNLQTLRKLAAQFVNQKNFKENGGKHRADEEEIVFDTYAHCITWTYEYNASCHCHPEMQKKSTNYSFESFFKWIKDNSIETEQYTEKELN